MLLKLDTTRERFKLWDREISCFISVIHGHPVLYRKNGLRKEYRISHCLHLQLIAAEKFKKDSKRNSRLLKRLMLVMEKTKIPWHKEISSSN